MMLRKVGSKMEEEKKNNKLLSAFEIIIYLPEEQALLNKAKAIVENYGGSYFYITHQPEEEDLKEHTHFRVLLSREHRVRLETLCNKLELPNNRIEFCHTNKVLFLQYLTHKNLPNKIQYEPEQVTSNNKSDFYNAYYMDTSIKFLSKPEEYEEMLNNLYYEICLVHSIRCVREVIDYLAKNNCLGLYSRHCHVIKDMIRYGQNYIQDNE